MRAMGVAATLPLLLTAGVSKAGTIRVPEDVPTVLAAVDLAMPGDSVLIGPGTWTDRATRVIVADNGPFQFTACAYARGGVLIRGAGIGATVLDVGTSTGTFVSDIVFVQRPGEGPLRVEQMTLTGASGIGGGYAITGGYADGLEMRSCRLEANRTAVGVLECSLTMEDCELVGNSSPIGVVRVDLTPVRMTRCRFEGNTGTCVTTIYDPGPVVPAVFQDCEFVRNRGPGYGTALNLQNVTGFLVERCLFEGNVAEVDQAGAAVRVSASRGEIRHSVFAFDSVYAVNSVGAGIWLEGGHTSVWGNTFVGCHATLNGTAFAAGFGASGSFTNNVVAHNTGGPAVRFAAGTSMAGGCNLFWQNVLGDFGGGGAPAPTDFVADPLFCDLQTLDLTVRDDSPCLFPPTPSCAPIGALGAGCGGVSIEPTSFGRIKSMFR